MRCAKRLSGLFIPVLAILAMTVLVTGAAATTLTWNVGSGNWDGAAANWTGSTWTDNNDAAFNGAGGTVTVVSGLNPTAGSLTFDAGNYVLTASSAGTISLSGGKINVAADVTAQVGATTSDVLALSGSSLYKDGPGTLNIYTTDNFGAGTTTVNDGILGIGRSSSIGSGAVVVNNGGALAVLKATSYTQGVTINGSTDTGALLAMAGGTIKWNGNVTLGSNAGIRASYNAAATVLGIGGTIDLNGYDLYIVGDLGCSVTSGTSSSGGGNGTISGAGTLYVSGSTSSSAAFAASFYRANTYTGLTDIKSGVLEIKNASALGGITNGTTVESGGQLRITTTNLSIAEPLTLNGNGCGDANNAIFRGALNVQANGCTLTGGITLGSDASILPKSSTATTISGAIDLGATVAKTLTIGDSSWAANAYSNGNIFATGVISGQGGITKYGTGSLYLTGASANTYDGSTIVNTGAVIAARPNNLPHFNKITVNNGGSVGGYLSGGGTTGWELEDFISLAFGATWNNGSAVVIDTTYGDNSAGGLDLTTYTTATVGLTKSGINKLTLTSTNNYSGPTNVIGGTLSINTGAFPASTSALNASGTSLLRLDIGVDNSLTFNKPVNLNNTPTDAAWGGLNIYSGSMTVSDTVTIGVGSEVVAVGGGDANASLALSGPLALGASSGFQILTKAAGNSCTISNVISGNLTSYAPSTDVLKINGPGKVYLTSSNTYNGVTHVMTGSLLNISDYAALGLNGPSNGGTTVDSGATLQLKNIGTANAIAESLTISGTGTSNNGALQNVSGNVQWGSNPDKSSTTGTITLAANSRINCDSGALYINGNIWGSGKTLTVGGAGDTVISGNIFTTAGSLTKDGLGTLTLSPAWWYNASTDANMYKGLTTVSGGTLKLVDTSSDWTGVFYAVFNGGSASVQGGKLLFNYDSSYNDATALANVQAALTSGRIYGSSENPPLICFDNALTDIVTVECTLFGDSDLNGTVNGADLTTVLSNYNKTGMDWGHGDFNHDGTVNGADLTTVLSNYNQHLSLGAAVPEPSTLLLAAAGLVGLLAYAWRKRKN